MLGGGGGGGRGDTRRSGVVASSPLKFNKQLPGMKRDASVYLYKRERERERESGSCKRERGSEEKLYEPEQRDEVRERKRGEGWWLYVLPGALERKQGGTRLSTQYFR